MQGITGNAGEALESMLKREEASDEKCVRLKIDESGQGSMGLDTARAGDRVFKHNDRDVLLVDPGSAQRCEGKKLDYSNAHFVLV